MFYSRGKGGGRAALQGPAPSADLPGGYKGGSAHFGRRPVGRVVGGWSAGWAHSSPASSFGSKVHAGFDFLP
jgi:hypothetical protein